MKDGLRQIIRFGLVGALNTGVSYAIYWLLLAAKVPATPAWATGYVMGMVMSLLLNRIWTFEQRERLRLAQVARFVVVNGAALLVSTGMLRLGIAWGLSERWAGIVATPCSMLVNFIGNKLWVFHA